MSRVLILNYGRALPMDDKGFKPLQIKASIDTVSQCASAMRLWSSAQYLSPHSFQRPDIVCNPSLPDVFNISVDTIYNMPPSNPALYITPAFWTNVADWLATEGIFVAVPIDDHVIDPYLTKMNKYDIIIKHKSFSYAQMTPLEQSTIDYCYSCLRTDISRLTNQQLRTISDVERSKHYLLYPDLVSYKALLFEKADTPVVLAERVEE